jgi:hypothetical protein
MLDDHLALRVTKRLACLEPTKTAGMTSFKKLDGK